MSDDPTPEQERLVELAHEMFDLARAGEADRLAAYVACGSAIGRQRPPL